MSRKATYIRRKLVVGASIHTTCCFHQKGGKTTVCKHFFTFTATLGVSERMVITYEVKKNSAQGGAILIDFREKHGNYANMSTEIKEGIL